MSYFEFFFHFFVVFFSNIQTFSVYGISNCHLILLISRAKKSVWDCFSLDGSQKLLNFRRFFMTTFLFSGQQVSTQNLVPIGE